MDHGSDLHRPRGLGIAGAGARCLLGLALVGTAGCAEPFLGTFTSTGGELGQWTATANFCASSVVARRLGKTSLVYAAHRTGTFSVFQINTGAVAGRIILVSLQTTDPPREIQLHPEDCARLDVRQPQQPDGSVGLDVELDCRGGEGEHFYASIHAETCRGPGG